jgi:hypothetical protein
VLGALLGGLISSFAPPMRARRAVLAGALGGGLAAALTEGVVFHAPLPASVARLGALAALGIGLGGSLGLVWDRRSTTVKTVAARGNATGFSLRLSSGRVIPLTDGHRLTSADLPGLKAPFLRQTVARLTRKPDNPSVLGLTNASRSAWSVRLPGGGSTQVEPGRSVRLAAGTRIDFGPLTGEIV